jgi:ABC-type transport system substrate-binding protein
VARVEAFFAAEHRASALQMYEEDRLDVLDLTAIPLAEQDRARQRHAAEYVSQPKHAVRNIGLDVSRPPFHDRRVRRALAMATDRETLASVVFHGLSFPATGGLWPPWVPSHSPGIALPYDPQRARRLLAEAGYPDGLRFPSVVALTFDEPRSRVLAEYLRAQWRENLGIDVSWEAVSMGEFLQRLKGGTHAQSPLLWSAGMAGFGRGDEVPTIEGWFALGWRNEAYEGLGEEIRHVTDPGERLRIGRAADRLLMEEAPTIILTYDRTGFLVKPWVTRIPLGTGSAAWWKDVVIEPH